MPHKSKSVNISEKRRARLTEELPDFRMTPLQWRRERWHKFVNLIPNPPADVLWQPTTPFVYPARELRWLPPAHLEAVLRVIYAKYQEDAVLDARWFADLDDEELTTLLNLWRPCEGCAPIAEMEEREHEAVTEKFFVPLCVASEMARDYWDHQFPQKKIPLLQPAPMVQPALEGDTQFAVLDWDRHVQYLRGREKAAKFKWCSLTAFSGWIIACMLRIVQVFEVTRRVDETSLKHIQQDPRYRKRADGGLLINAG